MRETRQVSEQLSSERAERLGFTLYIKLYDGEFDPGSGRTLAAWIRHASRTVVSFRGYESGERVSNA
jgi:hypothetical protein